ncbi:hypothetical protein A2U01_0056812, partial [Trifolium medium]|nr:hypothetical protein [Trifolium medium]
DPASKGSKRKSQDEAARISIVIPKKGEGVAAEGDGNTALAPPTKKKRATRGSTGRPLLQGGSAKNTSGGGDGVAQKDAEVVADNVQVPRPFCCPKSKKSKVSPPSFWDVDFNSLGFVEEQF